MKLTTVTVSIPFHGAGNVIRQQPVTFDVFREDGVFSAVPLLTEPELRLANIPAQLKFKHKDGRALSLWEGRDGNFHVIEELCRRLTAEGLV